MTTPERNVKSPSHRPDDRNPSLIPGSLDQAGFNLVARDLDRAFSLGLNRNQAVIMTAIREQSWTAALAARKSGSPRPDPIPARLNLTTLAVETGLNRSRLSTALNGLIAARILDRTLDGLMIRKDYAGWLDDAGKRPRFTRHQLAFIRAGRRRKYPSDSTRVTPEQVDPNSNSSPLRIATSAPEITVADCNTKVESLLQTATASVANGNSECCKRQQSPIEDRARLEILEIKREQAKAPAAAGLDEESDPPPPGQPSVQDLVELTLDVFADYPGGGDRQAQAIGVKAPGLIVELSGRADCLAAAIRTTRENIRNGTDVGKFLPYVLRIARDYAVEGIPEGDIALPAPKPSERGTPPALSPSQIYFRDHPEARPAPRPEPPPVQRPPMTPEEKRALDERLRQIERRALAAEPKPRPAGRGNASFGPVIARIAQAQAREANP